MLSNDFPSQLHLSFDERQKQKKNHLCKNHSFTQLFVITVSPSPSISVKYTSRIIIDCVALSKYCKGRWYPCPQYHKKALDIFHGHGLVSEEKYHNMRGRSFKYLFLYCQPHNRIKECLHFTWEHNHIYMNRENWKLSMLQKYFCSQVDSIRRLLTFWPFNPLEDVGDLQQCQRLFVNDSEISADGTIES